MRTKNIQEHHTRVSVTFDPLYAGFLEGLAKKEHKTMSSLVRELALEALELREDIALSCLAEQRDQEGQKTFSHEDAWK